MFGIYAIKNNANNKLYIGQSIDIEERRKAHFEALRSGRHYNRYLQNSFNKHGEHNFSFEILEETQNLDEREKYWISYYDTCSKVKGYNLLTGGKNFEMTDDVRIRISDSVKNFYFKNPEARENVSKNVSGEKNPFWGKTHTDEARKKIVMANIGRKQSEETKRKRSQALKLNHPNRGKKMSEESKLKMSLAKKGKPAHNKKYFSDEEICKIKSMYFDNYSLKEISELFKVSNVVIKRILVENNIYESKNPRKPLSEKEIDEILTRLNDKESLRSVAKEYNLTATGLKKKILRMRGDIKWQ